MTIPHGQRETIDPELLEQCGVVLLRIVVLTRTQIDNEPNAVRGELAVLAFIGLGAGPDACVDAAEIVHRTDVVAAGILPQRAQHERQSDEEELQADRDCQIGGERDGQATGPAPERGSLRFSGQAVSSGETGVLPAIVPGRRQGLMVNH